MIFDFYKFQGTGNDFVLIEDWENKIALDQALIERICNRRFGIGADGLILLQQDANTDFFMKYYNSDGNESSMCGNGGRCIAAFYHMQKEAKDTLLFNAIDGLHEAILNKESANVWDVKLKMKDVEAIQQKGNDFILNTGSPHYVRIESVDVHNLPIIEDAKKIRFGDDFKKEGINVNFVNLLGPESIAIRTYERGVEDETLSCGTGATASALITALHQKFPSGNYEIKTKVEGGELNISYQFNQEQNLFTNIWLCGPASLVFKGQINTELF